MKTPETILRIFKSAIVESVKAAGDQGAPAGPMYAAFMAHGVDLHLFNKLMDLCVQDGSLIKKGHLYYATKS